MVKIIQISDLHYKNDFREDCMENIINYINNNKPDAVLCTGDIAHKGRVSEYNGICEYLRKIKPKLLVIPGNHDVKNNGLIFY
ncbi:MAG: metallophosphoesterase family protein [Promethearchaeota archaeon]